MDRNAKLFLDFLATQPVELHLLRGKKMRSSDGHLCYGEFTSGSKPTIKCATGSHPSIWLPIICHEYHHYIQWSKGTRYYKYHKDIDDADSIYWNWVFRNELKDVSDPPAIVRRSLDNVLASEWDAERSTLKLLVKWNLRHNRRELIRKMNQYLYGLVFSFRLRERIYFPNMKVEPVLKRSWKDYLKPVKLPG